MAMSDSNAPDATDNAKVDALVTKHRAEIEFVKQLDSDAQQKIFRDLGASPEGIEKHYADYEQQSEQLNKRQKAANASAIATGVASMVAGTVAAAVVTHKFKLVKLVSYTIVPLSALASFVTGAYAGSKLFSGDIRDKSHVLSIESRDAFERELAVALENRERGASGFRGTTPQRAPSYADQAAIDKATVLSAENRRT